MLTRIVAATALLSTTACSVALTRNPKHRAEATATAPSCRSSWVWPIADTVAAGLFAVPTIDALATETEAGSDAESVKPYYVGVGALLTAVAATSAVIGYLRVSRCRGAKERFEIAHAAPPTRARREIAATPRARSVTPAAPTSAIQKTPTVTLPTPAPPSDVEVRAKAHGVRGDEQYDAGAFREAIDEYLAAFELVPRPALLYNIGLAYDQLKDRSRALEYYRRYMATKPTGPSADAARTRIVELSGTQTRG